MIWIGFWQVLSKSCLVEIMYLNSQLSFLAVAHIFHGSTLIYFPTTTAQEIVLIEDASYADANVSTNRLSCSAGVYS